jgi:alpha-tubulin suppressor-like RCC1 family protein
MKFKIFSLAAISLGALSISAEVPTDWPASHPEWWWNDDPALRVVDHTQPEGNASPLNQGQLLHMTEQGLAELNEKFAPIGGAQFEIDDLLDSDPSNYYAPANLGQLKHLSSKFYERFAELGFNPVAPDSGNLGEFVPMPLIAERSDGNLLGVSVYPWLDNFTASNLALANIGQAKHLFSWDLNYLCMGDGFIIIEDWPTRSAVLENGDLESKVTVQLVDSAGFLMSNYLLRFSVESGPFEFLSLRAPFVVATDVLGRATVSLRLNDTYAGVGSLRVTAGLGENAPSILLPISVKASERPSSPLLDLAEAFADGSAVITWEANEGTGTNIVSYEVMRDGIVVAVTNDLEYTDTLSSGWGQVMYQVTSIDLTGVRSEPSTSLVLRELPASGVAAPKLPVLLHNDGFEATVTWSSGASDYGIAAYHVLLDGNIVASSPDNRWTFTNLIASTRYTISVIAVDQRGEVSSASESLTFTTSSAPVLNLRAGGSQAYFFESGEMIRTFGRNDIRALGALYPDDAISQEVAQVIPVSSSWHPHVSSLAAGQFSSVLLDSDGVVSQTGVYQFESPLLVNHLHLPDFGDIRVGEIGCGLSHFMAIDSVTGEVYSWGQNITWQLGYPTAGLSESLIPSRVLLTNGTTPLSGATAVTGGYGFSVALMDDQSLRTWGHPPFLGRESPNADPQPPGPVVHQIQQNTLPRMRSISSGDTHTLALSSSGQLWSFGYNSHGQIGLGDPAFMGRSYAALPVTKNGNLNDWFENVTQISAGGVHSLALDEDGVVWSFGSNEFGQLGRTGDGYARQVTSLSGIEIVSIAASESSSYAYAADGSLWAWGRNNYGQLGDGTTIDRPIPTRILTGVAHLVFTPYREGPSANSGLFISASRIGSTLRYTLDGTEVTSTSSIILPSVAIYPAAGAQVRARAYQGDIALGEEHRWRMPTVLSGAVGNGIASHIDANGSLAVWGRSIDFIPGRLAGVGQPIGALADQTIRSVDISGTSAQALTYDGALYAWGDNSEGHLQMDGASRLLMPTQEPLLAGENIRSSAMSSLNETGYGGAHRLILSGDRFMSSGINTKGQLGLSTGPAPVRSFVDVDFSELVHPIENVYAGTGVSFAQDSMGHTVSWGDSRLAGVSLASLVLDPNSTDDYGPFRVAVSNLTQISSSVISVTGLRCDGTVWWWGRSLAANASSLYPLQIQTESGSLEDIISISSGYNHTLALRSDGSVWSWGSSEGALGYDGFDDEIARQVPGLTNIHWIAAGKEFSMAGDDSGNVWSWGRNTYGELGDISLPSGTTPVLVSIPDIVPLTPPTEDDDETPQNPQPYIPPVLLEPDPAPAVGPVISIEAPYDLQETI